LIHKSTNNYSAIFKITPFHTPLPAPPPTPLPSYRRTHNMFLFNKLLQGAFVHGLRVNRGRKNKIILNKMFALTKFEIYLGRKDL